jgi:AraC-like DNA-binding protein
MGIIHLSLERTRKIESANFVGYPDGALHPNRTMGIHDLFLLKQGGWEILENGTLFVMKPGDVIFLFAGRHHLSNTRCIRGTQTIYIHIHPEPDDAFIERGANRLLGENAVSLETIVHTSHGNLKISGLFEDVVRSSWSHSTANRIRARTFLGVLLSELSRISSHEELDPHLMPVHRAMDLIERDPGHAWPLDELAEKVRLNRRVLTTRFRAVTGMSVRQFLMQHRICIARSILDSMPTTPLKTIAGQLGFSDEYHLSHCFKRISGVSPREYRGKNAA